MLDGDIFGWIFGGRLEMIITFSAKNYNIGIGTLPIIYVNAFLTRMKHGRFFFVHRIAISFLDRRKGRL